MTAKQLKRVFKFGEQNLPDPGPQFSAAMVKDLYAANFPELVNAEVEGPNVLDGNAVYVFKANPTGTKGFGEAFLATPDLPFAERLALVAAGQPDPLTAKRQVNLDEKQANAHRAFGILVTGKQQFRKDLLPGLPSTALPLLL